MATIVTLENVNLFGGASIKIETGSPFDARVESATTSEADRLLMGNMKTLGIVYLEDNGSEGVNVRLDDGVVDREKVRADLSVIFLGNEYQMLRCGKMNYETIAGIKVRVEPS